MVLNQEISHPQCCNSDLCNTEPVPEPSEPVPNGLKCYSCVGDDCNRTVNCEGIQDHCATSTASLIIMSETSKGCASKSVCSIGNLNMWGGSIGIKTSCCQENFCNGATTATASLFVGPLIFLILFS
ncbi:urokinase plasminogen activator surface receptor-like [Oryzias melastigma]|uniref:urokinase plasminogen activator surface receptor-like n=1 Tax=Oryzias melastigma TaxID=30732 RepID=UPI00168CCBF2|nr:urokinase plasminogen activator surface receptor-like [Oryzias melastigma]